jgi:hypothetical protein
MMLLSINPFNMTVVLAQEDHSVYGNANGSGNQRRF